MGPDRPLAQSPRVRIVVTLFALFALVGAVAIVVITEVAVAFACGEGEPCGVVSDPMKMRAMAWATLAGTILSGTFALLRIKWATIAAVTLTGATFITWFLLFVYIVEGSL